jgi:hypothetical protein
MDPVEAEGFSLLIEAEPAFRPGFVPWILISITQFEGN